MTVFKEKSALLIVDMVHDFVDPEGTLYVPAARGIIGNIRELAAQAREAGVPVIYVNDSHEPDDSEFEKWPPHSITGSAGSRIIPELEPRPGDHILGKKRYSAFFQTELDELLKRLGVNHLVITGTVTNFCVFATALDAAMRGYDITVPRDGVAALSDEDQEVALKQISQVAGAELV